MHTPYISVIISCQVIEVVPLLSHSGDSRWLFTLSSSLCWALKESKMKKALSLWHRSKGQNQNRNIVMFRILNIFFSYSKHNPFPQCHIKPFIFSFSLHLLAPWSLNLLDQGTKNGFLFLFFPSPQLFLFWLKAGKEVSTYISIKYKIIGQQKFHLYHVSNKCPSFWFIFILIFLPPSPTLPTLVVTPQGSLCPMLFSLGSIDFLFPYPSTTPSRAGEN